MVNLTPADNSDSAGAQAILDGFRKRWPWVKHLFADGAYDRLKLMDKAAYSIAWSRSPADPTTRRASMLPAAGLSSAPSAGCKMAPPRARLRAAHRRLSRHDPCHYGRRSHPQKRLSLCATDPWREGKPTLN